MLAQAASFMVASTPTLLLPHRVGVKKLAANYKPIYTRSIWDWPPPHPSEGTVLTQTAFTVDTVRRLSGAESTYAVLTALLLVCVVLVYCLWLSALPPHPSLGATVHTNTTSSIEEVPNSDSTDEHVEAVPPAPCQDVHQAVDAISKPSRPPPVAPLYVEDPVHPPPVLEPPLSSLAQHEIVHYDASGRDAGPEVVSGSQTPKPAPIARLHVEETRVLAAPEEQPISSLVHERAVVLDDAANVEKLVTLRASPLSPLYVRTSRRPSPFQCSASPSVEEVVRHRDTIQPLQHDADSVPDSAALAAAAVHPSTTAACTKTESDVVSSSILQHQGQEQRTVHVLEGPSDMEDIVTALAAADAACPVVDPRFNSLSMSNMSPEFVVQVDAFLLAPLVRPAISRHSGGADGGVMSHRILARMEHIQNRSRPSAK